MKDTNGLPVLVLGSHLNFNLEYYVKAALERMGCNVRFAGYREYLGHFATPVRMSISRSHLARALLGPFGLAKFNDAVKKIGLEFEPTLVIVVKGEAIFPQTIDWFSEQIGCLNALWCPDDPRFFDSLSRHIAPHYDFIFTPSDNFLQNYRELGIDHVAYLPFACDPSIHRLVLLSDHDRNELRCEICFVGSYSPRRSKIISALEKGGFDVRVWGPYWGVFKPGPGISRPAFGPQLARVFSAARIVLNVHEATDLPYKPNMRVFEAAGCQSFIVSDRPWSLDRCFQPGEELACYDDEPTLIRLARHYLQEPKEAAEIAKRAQDRAYADHTYDHRVKTLLSIVS